MPTGPGSNIDGVWKYGETDATGPLFSDFLNKLGDSVRTALVARGLRQVLTRVGVLSVPNGAAIGTVVPWTATLAAGSTSFTQAAGVLTCAIAGTYDIRVSIPFAANATGYRYAEIRKNATTIQETHVAAGSSATKSTVYLFRTVVMAVNDTLDVRVSQNSTVALNIADCEISLARIA